MLSRSGMSNSVTLGTVACQAPLSMGSSKQEYWSRLPFPTSGDLPNPGIEPASPVSYIGRWIPYHQVTWKSHLLDNTQILFSMSLPHYSQYADCLSNRWALHAPNWSGQLPFAIASRHTAFHRPWELVQEWTCYPNSTPVRLLERFSGCIEVCLHFSETATKRESF